MEGPYYPTSIAKLDALSQVFATVKDWDGMPKLSLRFTTWHLECLYYYFGTCFKTFWSSGATPGSDDSESLTNGILFFDSNFATVKECVGIPKLLLHFTTCPLRHRYYYIRLVSLRLHKECNCRGQCQAFNLMQNTESQCECKTKPRVQRLSKQIKSIDFI